MTMIIMIFIIVILKLMIIFNSPFTVFILKTSPPLQPFLIGKPSFKEKK